MSLTIEWTDVVPAPPAGYRIKYRPTGSADPYTTVVPNPIASPCVITGLSGPSYEGTIEASCGDGNYGTPVEWSVGSSIMWESRRSTTLLDHCSSTSVTLYTAVGESFTTGDTVYTDAALTTPLTGYDYVSELASGIIYAINSGTGVIDANTGNAC